MAKKTTADENIAGYGHANPYCVDAFLRVSPCFCERAQSPFGNQGKHDGQCNYRPAMR
jgi:hypothetical protein